MKKDTNMNSPNFSVAISQVTDEMNLPNFWISKYNNSKDIVLSYDGIKNLNQKIIASPSTFGVYDLQNYSAPSSRTIKQLILNYNYATDKYLSTKVDDNGLTFPKGYSQELYNSLNINNITSNGTVKYGLTIIKTNLRAYPTDAGAYNPNTPYDMFQQSSLEVNQPVAILHTSKDNKWYFVQGYNYKGWCKISDIGLIEKEVLFNYLNSTSFIMITGNKLIATNTSSNTSVSYNMGAKLFLENPSDLSETPIVKVPKKLTSGLLGFDIGIVPNTEDFTFGYIPYTVENVINQAFKCLGDPYEWGNKYNSRDCSGFVGSVYNTMGFILPRDTNPMNKTPATIISLLGKSSDSIKNTIMNLMPGSLVFRNGHVVIYLGNDNGEPYIIHNHGSVTTSLTIGCEVTLASMYDYTTYVSTLTLN